MNYYLTEANFIDRLLNCDLKCSNVLYKSYNIIILKDVIRILLFQVKHKDSFNNSKFPISSSSIILLDTYLPVIKRNSINIDHIYVIEVSKDKVMESLTGRHTIATLI
jgi:hypothetical protein